MEASTLTHAGRLGLIGRRSPLVRLQGDERLIALIRAGHERAFEALVDRYGVRLLAFCRGMLGSAEEAEDVLQEVFVAAHKAILADNRPINARPWLYRIARNRCLNHLRKPVPDGQDSMDVMPSEHGLTTAERVQKREDFRELIADVGELPETQRTALLLREIDALSYEEIAVAMDTTVPAVKSLLVRARMSLTDCTQGRRLTCDEVHLELAEASEGLRKTSGPARAHLRNCDGCKDYRAQLRRNDRALAMLAPVGLLGSFGLLHKAFAAKLGFGGAGSGVAGAAGGTGSSALGLAGSAAAGGLGGALGTKAVAGVASVALLTAGAVEVNNLYQDSQASPRATERSSVVAAAGPAINAPTQHVAPVKAHHAPAESSARVPEAVAPPAELAPATAPESETPGGEVGPAVLAEAGTVEAESGTGVVSPDQSGSGAVESPDGWEPPPAEEPPPPAEELPPSGTAPLTPAP